MARLLVVSRSMALALRLADAHEVVEVSVDDLHTLVPGRDVDAVVLDVGEPALAIQTLDRLRGSGDTTPLLIVSGYQQAWDGLAAVDIPDVVVVPLPITRAALLDGIDLLVSGRALPAPPTPLTPPAPPTSPGWESGAMDEESIVDSPIRPTLPVEPVRVDGAGELDAWAAPEGPAVGVDPPASDELLRPFIRLTARTGPQPPGDGWVDPRFGWWPHGAPGTGPVPLPGGAPRPASSWPTVPAPATPPLGAPAPAEPGEPTAVDPLDSPARPLRRGWPPAEPLGPVLLPVDSVGAFPVDPGAPSADDLFPPFTAKRLVRDPRVTPGTALLPEPTATPTATVEAPRTTFAQRRPETEPEPAPDHPDAGPPPQPDVTTAPGGIPLPSPTGGEPSAGGEPPAGGEPHGPSGPATPLSAAARQRIATEFVAQLTPHVGYLVSVTETAQTLAEAAVTTGAAAAGALLVPDGGRWRVSGGVGLQPVERDLVLDASHWLIEQVALAGRALALEDTEEVRLRLAGAPLAGWPHLLATPVPRVQTVVLLARDDARPFSDVELGALSGTLRTAAELLESAVRARHLARLLAPLREGPRKDSRPR